MNHFSHIPMVRLILPLLAGIVIFTYSGYIFTPSQFLPPMLIFLITALLINRYCLPHFHLAFLYGMNVYIFLVFVGYLLAQGHYELSKPGHYSDYLEENAMMRIRLTEPVEEKTNSYQVIGRVTHIISQDSLLTTRGKIILWLQKDDKASSLSYGDVIVTTAMAQEVRPPRNPHAFNYKRFLERQNIFHQTYRRSGQWHFTGSNEGNRLIAVSHIMRLKALETLESNNISGRDFAVASALLLGYRDYLDEDLQREFAGAGAMHILCVSGLHVGIIFLVLNLLFGFLNKIPRGRYLKTLLIILLIWFYAGITGFAPSVMRASTMFSFVAIGQTFSRNTNIYNTLAASALVLVLIDPFIISRIGFQLSYIAVISIVSLQPLFYKQLYFKNKILDHAWGIITVSLAAQLGTGPLALYYFNQFPNYFLLTNLIVIPLTGLIIKTGIALFISAPVAIVSQFIGWGLSKIILLLHSSVRFIEGLPGSVSNDLVIGFHEKIIILSIIAMIGITWHQKKKSFVFISLLLLLGLSISITSRTLLNQNRKLFAVYHLPGASGIDIINGQSCTFYACNTVAENPSAINFNIAQNRLRSGVKQVTTVPFDQDPTKKPFPGKNYRLPELLYLESHVIKIIDDQTLVPAERVFSGFADHIIIRQNPRITISGLVNAFGESTFIFDNSNSIARSRQWLQECDSLGINCWSVSLQGAYVHKIP